MALHFLMNIEVEFVNGGGVEFESQVFVLIFICGVYFLLYVCGR